ncbi:hypothetical protein ILUMI_12231 [Ignelater luminosus]|uniref:THAP-type domain-containing protein n=1 Tax=Ignelater luminosus TaxID=2038154 RepID=A0A8K0CYZ7_IGNLU|nr:hypothetical protein ILUMI_12231 [Ignelater luminosus]
MTSMCRPAVTIVRVLLYALRSHSVQYSISRLKLNFEMPGCSAYGCKNYSGNKSNRKNGIFFYKFPNKNRFPKQFEKWSEYCKRKQFNPTANSHLCSKHFKESDLNQSRLLQLKLMPNEKLWGPRLKSGAVPSVKLLTSEINIETGNSLENSKSSRKCRHEGKQTEINIETGSSSENSKRSRKCRYKAKQTEINIERGSSSENSKRSRKCRYKAKQHEKFVEEISVASVKEDCTVEETQTCKMEIEEISISDTNKSVQCELGCEIFRRFK